LLVSQSVHSRLPPPYRSSYSSLEHLTDGVSPSTAPSCSLLFKSSRADMGLGQLRLPLCFEPPPSDTVGRLLSRHRLPHPEPEASLPGSGTRAGVPGRGKWAFRYFINDCNQPCTYVVLHLPLVLLKREEADHTEPFNFQHESGPIMSLVYSFFGIVSPRTTSLPFPCLPPSLLSFTLPSLHDSV
jgi:hypothetical protein